MGELMTERALSFEESPGFIHREDVNPGDTKIFVKSGNEVVLIEPSGKDDWVVERTKGASAGKQMICPVKSLVDSLE